MFLLQGGTCLRTGQSTSTHHWPTAKRPPVHHQPIEAETSVVEEDKGKSDPRIRVKLWERSRGALGRYQDVASRGVKIANGH